MEEELSPMKEIHIVANSFGNTADKENIQTYDSVISLVRQKKLDNITLSVVQDHKFMKKITKTMMDFKSFEAASATLAGIELWRMLKKKQHINTNVNNIFQQFYNLAT